MLGVNVFQISFFICFFFFLQFYLFIFGCTGSWLFCEGCFRVAVCRFHSAGFPCCGWISRARGLRVGGRMGSVALRYVVSFQTRGPTCGSCTARWTLNHRATRETQILFFRAVLLISSHQKLHSF